jgi:hypothetical protein
VRPSVAFDRPWIEVDHVITNFNRERRIVVGKRIERATAGEVEVRMMPNDMSGCRRAPSHDEAESPYAASGCPIAGIEDHENRPASRRNDFESVALQFVKGPTATVVTDERLSDADVFSSSSRFR